MLGNRLNKYISGCHILCLRWLRTNVHASASMAIHGRIQRGDNRSGPSPPPPPPPRPPLPPEKSQKYRVFQQYGSKLPSKHSMSSHHRHASESPFKWRFTGGPMMARLNSGIWILPSKKKRCQVGPPLATLSGSAHGLYIMRQSFVTTASPQPLSRTGISIAW